MEGEGNMLLTDQEGNIIVTTDDIGKMSGAKQSRAEKGGSSTLSTEQEADDKLKLVTDTTEAGGDQMQAQEMFWKMPELLENLFQILDYDSTFSLACAINKEILKKALTSKVWESFIKQKFDELVIIPDSTTDPFSYPELKELTVTVLKDMATLLRKMDMPKTHLHYLLSEITKKYHPGSASSSHLLMRSPNKTNDVCKVSGVGFTLLEQLEGALGTAEQEIHTFTLKSLGFSGLDFDGEPKRYPTFQPCISEIEARLSRQKRPAATLYIDSLVIDGEKGCEHLYKIMQLQVSPPQIEELIAAETLWGGVISSRIKQKGWHLIAESMKLRPGAVKSLHATRPALADAKEEDLRTVWNSLGPGGVHTFNWRRHINTQNWHTHIQNQQDGLQRLLQIVAMTDGEYAEIIPVENQEDNEWP